jgi:cytochrome P450
VNGEDHRRLRNLVNPALSPRAVDRYRPAMRRFLEQLLEQVPADGRCEFIGSFAKPYPSMVIAEVMGASLDDAPALYRWSNLIQRQFDPTSLMGERAEIEQAVAEFYDYEDELIARRRPAPGDDLISVLIGAEEAGDRLSDDELRNLILNILVGGVDTSQSQLAHAIRVTLAAELELPSCDHTDAELRGARYRTARAELEGHDGWLASAAVEEALRFEPITPFAARILVEEVEHRGVTFPSGSIVLVSAWHANREGVELDGFDLTAHRGGERLLTFGAGIHYCVGANLARAEMQEGLAFLAERVSSLALDGEPEFGTPSGIYGLETLPLKLELA